MVYFLLLSSLIAKTNIAKAIISCSASNTDNSGSPFLKFDTYIHKHHLLEWIATIFSLFYDTYYKTRLAGLLALFLCKNYTSEELMRYSSSMLIIEIAYSSCSSHRIVYGSDCLHYYSISMRFYFRDLVPQTQSRWQGFAPCMIPTLI